MAELKNIRIAVSGIYDYAKEEIPTLRIPMPGQGAPSWVEDKRIYKVYRPASVLAAAKDKFANLPLTHHHPKAPVDGQNFRDVTVGWTGANPDVDYIGETNEVGIRSTMVMGDDEALKAYENGEIQLSPGYIAIFEWKKGTAPNGEDYDIVMKEITDVNHLALLPAGRGGEYAVVMDEVAKRKTVFDLIKEKTSDGAPKGNDNASKDHVKKYNEDDKELEKNFKKVQQIKPVKIDNNRNITDQKEAEKIFRSFGEVKNKTDGRSADFAVQTVGKILRHKGFEYGKIIESANDLFKNAQKVYSNKEEQKEGHKSHPNITAYHNYINKVELDGHEYYIRFTTREFVKGKKELPDNMHSCAVSEIALYENKKANSTNVSGSTPGENSNQPFIDYRLSDFFKYVNENNQQVKDSDNSEIIMIYSDKGDKSIFEIAKGTIFDRAKYKLCL